VCDPEVRATAERAGCSSEYRVADECFRADPPRCTDAGFTGAECSFEYRRLRYCVAVNSPERCAEEFGECGRCVCEACPCDQQCEVGRLEHAACVISCEGEPAIDSCMVACDRGRPDLATAVDGCWLSAIRIECPSECNAPPAP
jgi:hypothetical protein